MVQIVYNARKDYVLPDIDLLTLLFDSPLSKGTEDTKLHAEAADPTNYITKRQARTYTKRIAYHLRNSFQIGANGPGKDVVVCISSGQVLLPTVFWGIIAAGGVYSAASSSFTAGELARQVKQGKSSLLIASPDCKDVAVKAAEECGVPLSRVLVLESYGAKRSLQDVHQTGPDFVRGDGRPDEQLDWKRISDPTELDRSRICLLYSSGTTGPPKGVIVSHRNMVSEGFLPHLMLQTYIQNEQLRDSTYDFQYRTVAHLPAAHVAGVQGYFVNPAIVGGCVYWMPKFDFLSLLEYSKKYSVTHLFTVPPICLLLAKSPAVTDQFRTLEHIACGAAPMGADLQNTVRQKLGCNVTQTWGLSETTGSFTQAPWDFDDSTGSVGPMLPNMRLRIVDEDGEDVDEGLEGEFLVKGPVVCQGYWDNEQATRDSFTADGWFRTGDVGRSREGKFYITDRKKELIKYKGMQVAPAELEALLISHTYIADAAVIGVPDLTGSGNELPRAYVVADKSKVTEKEIKDLVRTNLAQHKQLRGGVFWLDTIPKSPSGKILRKDLRELAKRESNV